MEVLYVKNMVCDRCKSAVRDIFEDEGVRVRSVDLGVVKVENELSAPVLNRISDALKSIGFELLADARSQIVERIKALVIEMLRYDGEKSRGLNVSAYLSDRLHSDYSALSKMFSAETGTTIEKYVIAQKVELVKELITYGEMSLTEMAQRLNYSSVAYLSSQFKSVTGMTPSQYKSIGVRRELDRV